MGFLVLGLLGEARAALELWAEEEEELLSSIDLVQLNPELGPQSFDFSFNLENVVVHTDADGGWDCLGSAGRIPVGTWEGRLVILRTTGWLNCNDWNDIYRSVSLTLASVVIKADPFDPPGVYVLDGGRISNHPRRGTAFGQVYQRSLEPFLNEVAARARLSESPVMLRVVPDEHNQWEDLFCDILWVITVRICCCSVCLATAIIAALCLRDLGAKQLNALGVDSIHVILIVEFARNLLVAAMFADGAGTSWRLKWLPAGIRDSASRGLPGIALYSWILLALTWREVRHTTLKLRPRKNILKRYACIVAVFPSVCILDLWVLRRPWTLRSGYDSGMSFRVLITAPPATGVCLYLLLQSCMGLRLRDRMASVDLLDEGMGGIVKVMTRRILFGAVAAQIWNTLVWVRVLVPTEWVWRPVNFLRFWMLNHIFVSMASLCFILSMVPLARSGGTVVDRYGKWLAMLDAATAASLMGEEATEEVDTARVLQEGLAGLRGICLSELQPADMDGSTSTHHLQGDRREHGEVDWFVSHSWHDDPADKWNMLEALVQHFVQEHGREPVLWIDKFCIDQTNISSSLKYLPIWLLACQRMVVLAGPTYASRLWCNWELFVCYGITKRPMLDIAFYSLGGFSLSSFGAQLKDFDIARASCFMESDRAKILDIVDKFQKGREGFNRAIRRLAQPIAKAGSEWEHDDWAALPLDVRAERSLDAHGNLVSRTSAMSPTVSLPVPATRRLLSPTNQSTVELVSTFSGELPTILEVRPLRYKSRIRSARFDRLSVAQAAIMQAAPHRSTIRRSETAPT